MANSPAQSNLSKYRQIQQHKLNEKQLERNSDQKSKEEQQRKKIYLENVSAEGSKNQDTQIANILKQNERDRKFQQSNQAINYIKDERKAEKQIENEFNSPGNVSQEVYQSIPASQSPRIQQIKASPNTSRTQRQLRAFPQYPENSELYEDESHASFSDSSSEASGVQNEFAKEVSAQEINMAIPIKHLTLPQSQELLQKQSKLCVQTYQLNSGMSLSDTKQTLVLDIQQTPESGQLHSKFNFLVGSDRELQKDQQQDQSSPPSRTSDQYKQLKYYIAQQQSLNNNAQQSSPKVQALISNQLTSQRAYQKQSITIDISGNQQNAKKFGLAGFAYQTSQQALKSSHSGDTQLFQSQQTPPSAINLKSQNKEKAIVGQLSLEKVEDMRGKKQSNLGIKNIVGCEMNHSQRSEFSKQKSSKVQVIEYEASEEEDSLDSSESFKCKEPFKKVQVQVVSDRQSSNGNNNDVFSSSGNFEPKPSSRPPRLSKLENLGRESMENLVQSLVSQLDGQNTYAITTEDQSIGAQGKKERPKRLYIIQNEKLDTTSQNLDSQRNYTEGLNEVSEPLINLQKCEVSPDSVMNHSLLKSQNFEGNTPKSHQSPRSHTPSRISFHLNPIEMNHDPYLDEVPMQSSRSPLNQKALSPTSRYLMIDTTFSRGAQSNGNIENQGNQKAFNKYYPIQSNTHQHHLGMSIPADNSPLLSSHRYGIGSNQSYHYPRSASRHSSLNSIQVGEQAQGPLRHLNTGPFMHEQELLQAQDQGIPKFQRPYKSTCLRSQKDILNAITEQDILRQSFQQLEEGNSLKLAKQYESEAKVQDIEGKAAPLLQQHFHSSYLADDGSQTSINVQNYRYSKFRSKTNQERRKSMQHFQSNRSGEDGMSPHSGNADVGTWTTPHKTEKEREHNVKENQNLKEQLKERDTLIINLKDENLKLRAMLNFLLQAKLGN